MRHRWHSSFLKFALGLVVFQLFSVQVFARGKDQRLLVMVHLMPWFGSKPIRGSWGWHWTMSKQNPDTIKNGLPDIASHFHPLVGPYDSGDIDLITYQLLTMKLAGIDGVLIDWYGVDNLLDYWFNHENTLKIVEKAESLGLRFGIVYEDQTIKTLVDRHLIQRADSFTAARRSLKWVADNWFTNPDYLHVNGKPVMMVFGPSFLNESEWKAALLTTGPETLGYTLMDRRAGMEGGFDWPLPKGGPSGSDKEHEGFLARAKGWHSRVDVAFPRFNDFYAQAGVGQSWGHVPDDGGVRFKKLLISGLDGGAPVLQLVTWNDWGEGTQIEPSIEFGFRDLETVQREVKKRRSGFAFNASDLRLPAKLYVLRKKAKSLTGLKATFSQIQILLEEGRTKTAAEMIKKIESGKS